MQAPLECQYRRAVRLAITRDSLQAVSEQEHGWLTSKSTTSSTMRSRHFSDRNNTRAMSTNTSRARAAHTPRTRGPALSPERTGVRHQSGRTRPDRSGTAAIMLRQHREVARL